MTVAKPDPLRNDDHILVRKNDLTVILDTTDKYTVSEDFLSSTTTTLLVYAETIEITGNIRLPGKNLGLFCTKIIVPQQIKIDVSGKRGATGTHSLNDNGGVGGPGADAGNVWIFVQDLAAQDLENLDIQANGGEGGIGGDASAREKTGGKGGNGGNGGLVQMAFGSRAKVAMDTFRHIDQAPWPEKVSGLLELDPTDGLFHYVTEKHRTTLRAYQVLGGAMRSLISVIGRILGAGQQDNTRALAQEVVAQMTKNLEQVKEMPAISEETSTELQGLCSSLENDPDITKGLQRILALVGTLAPGRRTELSVLLDKLYGALDSEIRNMEADIWRKVKENKAGASGPGGNSGPGLDPGPRGEAGKAGVSDLQWMNFDTTSEGLLAYQTYIFPEQCQMLLNKADRQFFSADWKSRRPLMKLYDRLVQRLTVVAALEDKSNETSRLSMALAKLENDYKVTTDIVGQLRSIADQARSRRNRLALGQDMFGHSQTWVPRLSYDFYAQSIKDRLKVLGQIEELEARYRAAGQKEDDLRKLLDDGIKKIKETEAEAATKIGFLAGRNGEIAKIGTRILCLTLELPEKRKTVKTKMAQVTFEHPKLDPQVLLDGLSTLTSLKPDVDTLKGLLKLGGDIFDYIKNETIKNDNGDEFNEELIVRQLAECTDSLESLDAAIKTRKDNTLSLDDPKGLKVMAKVKDIQKLMDNFKKCIPKHQREHVDKALDDYLDAILKRNDAVLEYNSSVQMLMDARRDEKNAQAQAASLSEKRLELDPTIPAVSLWLRGTKDKLSLQLMQRLYYASRAVAYWGLENSFKFEKPGPLRSSVELQTYRMQLDGQFESILNRYAGNVRSVWPRTESDKGLFYDLTSEQLASLTTGDYDEGRQGKVYKVTISLPPKAKPFGPARADVRLSEVRFWLVGAKVNRDGQGRHRLITHVRHMGDDVFEDGSNSRFTFSHDSVSIPFEFDTAKVQNSGDLTDAAMLSRADALHNQWTGGQTRKETGTDAAAAVGPFATWRLEVREVENEGLDLQGVTSAHLEFRGANRSFT